MQKFLFAVDLHFGYERRGGHKVALHDLKAWSAVLAFAKDFKPDLFILGGDMLDCAVISHHNQGKPGRTEGMRLLADAQEGHSVIIEPIEKLMGDRQCVYMVGNHEDWLNDLTEEIPALEGLVDIRTLLRLEGWTVIDQGGHFDLGKLTFTHGDALKGGEHIAKAAVIAYERSIRFGHHHTHQTYTKNSILDYKHAKTGIAVPCLCTKDPKYGEGAPNRWSQGFLYGYVQDNGTFRDYVVTIVDGVCIVNDKLYGKVA